jgi:hypothetical protein
MLGTWKVDYVQLKSFLQSWESKQSGKTRSKSNLKTNEKTSFSKKQKSKL